MNIKIVKSDALLALIVALWLVAWISEPGVGAIHSASDVANSIHKVAARIAIMFIIALYYFNQGRVQRLFRYASLFLIFIIWNVGTLLLSANVFYSISRLLEFGLMAASCFLIVDMYNSRGGFDGMFRLLFKILTVHLLIALALFYFNPDWGGKMSGFSKESGAMTYRFGGAFLRLDLIAAMAGSMVMYWLFCDDKKISHTTAYLGLSISIIALILAHSRSSLITATLIAFGFLMIKKNKNPVYLLLSFFLLMAGVYFYWPEILNFYTRGETAENLLTGSGRLYLYQALMEANSWVNLLIGNGYLMNSPTGLYFTVDDMNTDMASPHNGYFSVLLGSGLFGLGLILIIKIKTLKMLLNIRKNGNFTGYAWMLPAVLYLSITTFADYGIWGVISPGLMIFCMIYFTARFITDYRRAR